MAFSQSSTTITQSGTDTNLSGLLGLTGVSSVTNAAQGGNYASYDISNNKLIVNGILTIDPEFESLMQDSTAAAPHIEVNGTLNIGRQFLVNGVTRYSTGLAIKIGGNRSPWDELLSSIRVNSGGSLHFYGGTINILSPLSWMEGSTIRAYSTNAVVFMRGLVTDQTVQVRQRSSNCEIYGITLVSGLFTIIVPPTLFSGVSAIHSANSVFSPSGSTASNTWITINDYDERGGNVLDFACWSRKWMRAINNRNGSGVTFGGHLVSDNNNVGFCAYYSDISFSAKDTNNATINTFGVFTKDKLNITRTLRLPANRHGTNENFQPDRIYANQTINGTSSVSNVLIAVSDKNVTGNRFDNIVWDYRGEQNNSTDVFNWRIRSYEHLFQTVNVPMKGVGGVSLETTLFDDPAITQSTAVAQAHTGITVSQHAPTSWNGLSYSITITGNRTTNPSLTASDIYHYIKYHLSQTNTTFSGVLGGVWHNLLKSEGNSFSTERGSYDGERIMKGVRVVDETGAAFPGFSKMQADSGSFYTAPTQITLTGLKTNSEVRVYTDSAGENDTVVAGVENSTSSFSFGAVAGSTINIMIHNLTYLPADIWGFVVPSEATSIPITQFRDRQYFNG